MDRDSSRAARHMPSRSTRCPRRRWPAMAAVIGLLAIQAPILPCAAHAEAHGRRAGAGENAVQSPYSGQAAAPETGLLAAEVEALASGAGMALALAAEVNGYPGPRHVLEATLAGRLALRQDQRRIIQQIFDRMHDQAVAKGREILDAEARLATRFRNGHIDEPTLREVLDGIGRLRAELRLIHLRAHLETRALLTADQVAQYNAARGYGADGGPKHGH
jgi:Spy/CpxP family protein refolding chaperone